MWEIYWVTAPKKLVTMSRKKILIHRYETEGLQELAKYRGAKGERFVWVSVADINHNGRDEIYVTSQKKLECFQKKALFFCVGVGTASNFPYWLKDID